MTSPNLLRHLEPVRNRHQRSLQEQLGLVEPAAARQEVPFYEAAAAKPQ